MDRSALNEFVERARGMGRRELLEATLVEVVEAFDSSGVPSLLLKGPALARMLYADEEPRAYADIDLLVPPSDLSRARAQLHRLGFGYRGKRLGLDDVSGGVYSETWSRRTIHAGGPLLVDLHWRLTACGSPGQLVRDGQLVWEVLAARRTGIEVNGYEVSVLAREGLALHLALHAAQHGPNDHKAIGDLTRGIERWPSQVWVGAAELAAELGGGSAFAAGLRLVPAGRVVAEELQLPAPTRAEIWITLNRDTRPRATFHLDAFGEAQGIRGRVNLLRRSLLPTSGWIVSEYAWASRSRARLALAYAVHLARAPVWAARAWRFRRRALRAGR